MSIRVFLISDFLVLLQGLADLILSRSEYFCLSGVAETYDAAIPLVTKTNPDLILLDIDSDPEQVLSFINDLHAVCSAKILLITRLSDFSLQDQAIIAGARGVIDKSIKPDMLLTAIEKVHEGQVWLSKVATGRIFVDLLRRTGNTAHEVTASKISLLTGRELEIVAFIACNGSDSGKTIARKLCISESTLRNHLTAIYHKLEVVNRHGLIAFAFQNGIVESVSTNHN